MVVATDDERIALAVRRVGAEVVITGAANTGTDRVAMAARQLHPKADVVVNLQGDEPLIEPKVVEALVAAMDQPGVVMATLSRPLEGDDCDRPQVVKVVTDARGDALYFSRAAIPFRRSGGRSFLARAHVGIYAFTGEFLETFTSLPQGKLEQEEALEQLRALENGFRIRVVESDYRGFGVDTPEDLARAHVVLAGGM